MLFDKLVWEQAPQRTVNTYKRMIALAIAERDAHEDIPPAFKLCIPHVFLHELALHFPHYTYHCLGGCFQDRDQVYVTWIPFS